MVVRKMKEKCKDAARMRREKERTEFIELSKLLPLPSSTTTQLDKASIIRLASSYLRMRSAFPEGLGENWGNDISSCRITAKQDGRFYPPTQISNSIQPQPQIKELGSLILQTLDGFVFALHRDGKIMYISETASVHLGLPQIDLTGSSVFEYIHPSDHNDLHEILSLSDTDQASLDSSRSGGSTQEIGRSFCLRMKCILPKRNAGLVTSGYKAIHCNGYLKVKYRSQSYIKRSLAGDSPDLAMHSRDDLPGLWESYALVAVGHSLLPTASTEIKLNNYSFMFRANLDFKLYYVEAPLLGYEQVEVIGQSFYHFVHVNDTLTLESSHRSLLDKGQVVTKYYRLIKKEGGSIWVQSYATLVSNARSSPKAQQILGVCIVIGHNPNDGSKIWNQVDVHKAVNSNMAPRSCSSIDSRRDLTPIDGDKHLGHSSGSTQPSQRTSSKPLKAVRRSDQKNSAKVKSDLEVDFTVTSKPTNSTKPTFDDLLHITPDKIKVEQIGPVHQQVISHPSERAYSNGSCSCQIGSDLCNLQYSRIEPFSVGYRRLSDDTSSLVSSVASTSLSGSSSITSHSLSYQDSNPAKQFPLSYLSNQAPPIHSTMMSTVTPESSSSSSSPSASMPYGSTTLSTPTPGTFNSKTSPIQVLSRKTVIDSRQSGQVLTGMTLIESNSSIPMDTNLICPHPDYQNCINTNECLTMQQATSWRRPVEITGNKEAPHEIRQTTSEDPIHLSFIEPTHLPLVDNSNHVVYDNMSAPWNVSQVETTGVALSEQQHYYPEPQCTNLPCDGSVVFSESVMDTHYQEFPHYLSNGHSTSNNAIYHYQQMSMNDGYTVTSV